MFISLTNTPRDYAWGSTTAIAGLLDRAPSGGPEAEYWLGTHPGSPTRLAEPVAGGATLLAQITTLPFLLKILAADSPLSLQVHPTLAQARAGFARENAAGIPLDAPNRNYRDDLYKPELIFALSEPFEALYGFRPLAATRRVLSQLGAAPEVDDLIVRLSDDEALPSVFAWLLARGPEVDALISRLVELAEGSQDPEARMVTELAALYPGDPGVVIALLLNRVELHPGEALSLPAGNIHAYLRGVGIELMAASDNVLRGGLTPKHVDTAELARVVDFESLTPSLLRPATLAPGVAVFAPDVPDFELVVIRPQADDSRFALEFDAIVLCIEGSVLVTGATGDRTLLHGDAIYISVDERELRFTGDGRLFLATTNYGSREPLPSRIAPAL